LILLDTHVLVWFAARPDRLSKAALSAIEAEPDRAIAVVSAQEIAYLAARGRLGLDRPVERWLSDALAVHSVRAVAATVSTSLRAGSLDPDRFHGDPIDRLLYATAVEHDARLVTADRRLLEFDPERTVW
jgi:PIN domain nuclease of toxin-antitoxin system